MKNIIILTIVILALGLLPRATSAVISTDPLILKINQHRQSAGLKSLKQNNRLVNGATKRAEYLSKRQQWSHDGLYLSTVRAGLGAVSIAENLARNYKSEDEILIAWENSKWHRYYLYNPRCTVAGVGRSENYTVLWLGYCK